MKMIKKLVWAGMCILILFACCDLPLEEVSENDCPFQQAKDTEVKRGNEKGFKISGDLKAELGKLISKLKTLEISGPELGATIEFLDEVKSSSSESIHWGSEKVTQFNLFTITLCGFYKLSNDQDLPEEDRLKWAQNMEKEARELIKFIKNSPADTVSSNSEGRNNDQEVEVSKNHIYVSPTKKMAVTFLIRGEMEHAQILLDEKEIFREATSTASYLKILVPNPERGHKITLKSQDRKCTLRFRNPSPGDTLIINNCKEI